MLAGERDQQLERNLTADTIANLDVAVRVFAAHADAKPWEWSA